MVLAKFGIGHGRFQPPHREHVSYLLEIAERCEHLIVGITNPDPSTVEHMEESSHRHLGEANPYSFFHRLQMLRLALSEVGLPGHRYSIVPFDLFRPLSWSSFLPMAESVLFLRIHSAWERRKRALFAQNGLHVQLLPKRVKSMTASQVRANLQQELSVSNLVLPSVERYIRLLEISS